jgi:hypothetical protein
MQYMAADRSLVFSMQVPTRKSPAPAYILLPDLTETFWYGVNPREGAPTDFFGFQGCAPAPRTARLHPSAGGEK